MKALIFALMLVSFHASADMKMITVDGQETQNGGGAAEQTFAYALTVLKPLYQMCLSVNDCVTVAEQRDILQKINDSMDEELASPALLRFAAAWWPEFMRDGQIRVAVTGSKVGDTIYVNRDMIYSRMAGVLIPYNLSQAVSLLTHELGHHQGEKDHELLDMLGANVRAFFDRTKETLVVDAFANRFASTDIRLNVFHARQTFMPYAHLSTFWLSVGESFFDLNPDIRRQMTCTKAITTVTSMLKGYRFFQMHWGERLVLPNGRVQYPLEAKIWMECAVKFEDGHVSHMAIPHRARLFFEFIPVGQGKLVYVDHSLRINLEPEKQY